MYYKLCLKIYKFHLITHKFVIFHVIMLMWLLCYDIWLLLFVYRYQIFIFHHQRTFLFITNYIRIFLVVSSFNNRTSKNFFIFQQIRYILSNVLLIFVTMIKIYLTLCWCNFYYKKYTNLFIAIVRKPIPKKKFSYFHWSWFSNL